jgi:hypothetical protein
MRKFFLLILVLSTLGVNGQIVDGVDIWKDSTVQYIQIVGSSGLLNRKVVISVDYGQKVDWGTDSRMEDENGKIIKLNSLIHALNYFYAKGWDFVTAYTVTVGNSNVYHYTLRRAGK